MATSAFKSTSRRSSIAPGDGGSGTRPTAGGAHRRSRSLSRYSCRFPPPPQPEVDEFVTPSGKFVNKTRGSGFPDPEISIDDLADEFFGTKGFEAEEEEEESRSSSVRTGRSGRRGVDERFRMETESSRRRGRSVSKKGSFGNVDGSRQQRRSVSVVRRPTEDFKDKKGLFNGERSHHDRSAIEKECLHRNDHSSRLRRSASVARHHCSDLESDTDKSCGSRKLRSHDNGNFHLSSSIETNNSHALRRSTSQKIISQSLDNYSSHSSSLTDDEIRDIHPNKSGPEKTIEAVFTLEKAEHPTGDGDGRGLYEAMRNEVRHAVHEIRTELEKVMVKGEPAALATGDAYQLKGSNSIHVIAEIRRNYTNKLEQSEKRKQELMAELAAEEQRGQELTTIVKELLPAQKEEAAAERASRSRRRSNDRKTMSNRLIEEAGRYFEDFLSNVEDTDISSFDGEISDTSSTLGGRVKLREPVVPNAISEVHTIQEKAIPLHADTDGVLLPWLDWETSSDASPLPCKSNAGVPGTVTKDANVACDSITNLSGLGSWSPEGNDSSPAVSSQAVISRFGLGSHLTGSSGLSNAGRSSFDMDDYLELQRGEDLLFQMLKQRQWMESGTLILCGRAPF